MTSTAKEVVIGVLEGTATSTRLMVGSSVSTPDPARRRRVPASIPKSQAYYWTYAWQAGEQETLDALAAGKGIEFASAREAIQ